MNQENQPHQIKRVLTDKSNIRGPEFVQGKKRAHAVMFLDEKKPKKNKSVENQENQENNQVSEAKPVVIKQTLVKQSIKVKEITQIHQIPQPLPVAKNITTEDQENIAPVDPFNKPPFDEELDDDPLMCSDYILSIMDYLRQQEVKTLPNSYNSATITSKDRFKFMNDLIEVHHVLRLMPETIFLACNIFDRVVTTIKVSKDQSCAVMLTSVLIAAKFEEIFPPSVRHITKRGLELGLTNFNTQKVYDIEQEILKTIQYDLSYPNPFNFLRRASKADDYNSETRTVAKYFMELSVIEDRLVEYTPSRIAAAAFWCSTKMLKKCQWVFIINAGCEIRILYWIYRDSIG